MSSIVFADSSRIAMKIYHGSSFALCGLVPAAAIVNDRSRAIDLALGVALPAHSHIALNFVRRAFDEREANRRENEWRWKTMTTMSRMNATIEDEMRRAD